jgi:hypothetical protein
VAPPKPGVAAHVVAVVVGVDDEGEIRRPDSALREQPLGPRQVRPVEALS